MVNFIWIGMFVSGIVYAGLNGTINEVNKAIFDSAKEAVTICIGLVSVLVFWLGIMKVAEEAGLLRKLSKLLFPVVSRLFPEIPKGHPAMGYIVSNLVANIFGLGNAATPLGIKAMEELQKINTNKDRPSNSMITFIGINTSCLTILPTTVIVLRMNHNSSNPTEIIGAVFIASLLATIFTIIIDKILYFLRMRKEQK